MDSNMVEEREQTAQDQKKIAKNKTGVESVDMANEKNYLEAQLAAENAKIKSMGGDPSAQTEVPPPRSLESAERQLTKLQNKDTSRMSADEKVKHRAKIADVKQKIAVRTLKWQVQQAKEIKHRTQENRKHAKAQAKQDQQTDAHTQPQNQFKLKPEHMQFAMKSQHGQFNKSVYSFGNFAHALTGASRQTHSSPNNYIKQNTVKRLHRTQSMMHNRMGKMPSRKQASPKPVLKSHISQFKGRMSKPMGPHKSKRISTSIEKRPALPKIGSIHRTKMKATSFRKSNTRKSKLGKGLL